MDLSTFKADGSVAADLSGASGGEKGAKRGRTAGPAPAMIKLRGEVEKNDIGGTGARERSRTEIHRVL